MKRHLSSLVINGLSLVAITACSGSLAPTVQKAPRISVSSTRSHRIVSRRTRGMPPDPNLGDVLRASTGSWTNTPASYTYRWQHCNRSASSCTNISGAKSATYTVTKTDAGYHIRVDVTAHGGAGSTTAASALTASVPDDAIGSCSTAEPTSDVTSGGHTWTYLGGDDFNKAAATGSFATNNASRVVYTGDQGLRWVEYPDGWAATFTGSREGYQPSTVLSVHDGVMDFYLHDDANGNPVGADPSPILPGSTIDGGQYQTYGRYSLCEKITPSDSYNLNDFVQAVLLWPESDANWQYAESDFPNEDMSSTTETAANAHYGGAGAQDHVGGTANMHDWNVFTQEWGPGYRRYYINGTLIGTTTNQVWSQPERWQIQEEPSGNATSGAGHLYVDWVAIWRY